MHKMKRIIAIVCTVVLIISFPGCFRQHEYPFGQTMENVASIEIVYTSPYIFVSREEWLKTEALAVISPTKQSDFMVEFNQIPCRTQFMDPIDTPTGYMVRISYQNGAVDIIGEVAGAYYDRSDWEKQICVLDEDMYHVLIQKALDGEFQ